MIEGGGRQFISITRDSKSKENCLPGIQLMTERRGFIEKVNETSRSHFITVDDPGFSSGEFINTAKNAWKTGTMTNPFATQSSISGVGTFYPPTTTRLDYNRDNKTCIQNYGIKQNYFTRLSNFFSESSQEKLDKIK